MAIVTPSQQDTIRTAVETAGLTHSTLIDDVCDHLCCAVEFRMDRGQSFDQAFADAANELAPDGLNTLQRETIFLLNAKKIRLIKKMLYGTGMVSAMAISMGILLKGLHFAVGTEVFAAGLMTGLLVTLPMIFLERFKFKMQKNLSGRIAIVCGIAAAILLATGIAFKTNYMPGANLIIVIAAMVFTMGFLPLLFLNVYRKSIEETITVEQKFESELE